MSQQQDKQPSPRSADSIPIGAVNNAPLSPPSQIDRRQSLQRQSVLQRAANERPELSEIAQLQNLAAHHQAQQSSYLPALFAEQHLTTSLRANEYSDAEQPLNETTPIQRMVAVAKASITGDLIEANSIKYAKDLAGGPIGLLHDMDYSKLPDGGSLYIVAHGSKTKSGIYSAGQILGYLLDDKTGLRKDVNKIKIAFTSCHAGEGTSDPKVDSVTALVASGLKSAGLTNIMVFGARGLSLKSSATGDDFTVIDPDQESEYWPLQTEMLDKHKPKETYAKWLLENNEATLEERGNKASEISQAFYMELIYTAEARGLTLPNQEAMSVHKINDKGDFYYKMRNMAESPFMDIEDYGSPWEKLN